MDDLARLQVRIDANNTRFTAGMRNTRSLFDRQAGAIEARAARLDSRVSSIGARAGSGFSRQGRATLGNIGQQIQDIAVQAEIGTDKLRIFAQQGPQILGAFGPFGAVLGAVVAVGASFASVMTRASDATDDAAESADNSAFSNGQLESAINQVISAAESYSNAISGTAASQVSATDVIVSQTEREFNAKKKLLSLQLDLARARQTEIAGDIAKNLRKQNEAGALLSRDEFIGDRLRGRRDGLSPDQLKAAEKSLGDLFDRNFSNQLNNSAAQAAFAGADEASRKVAELREEMTLLNEQIAQGDSVLGSDFKDIGGKRDASKGGGSRRSPAKTSGPSFIEIGRERVAALRQEQEALSLTGVELERYRARQEAAKLAQELWNAAAKESGGQVLPEQEAAIRNIVQRYLEVADSAIIATEASRQFDDQQKAAAKSAQELSAKQAQFFQGVSSSIFSAIEAADSFTDALKRIGLQLAQLAVNDLLKGPGKDGKGGSAIIGVVSDIAGSLFNAKGNAFNRAGVMKFAKGGVVNGPTPFQFGGGNLGLMGEAGPEAILPLSRGPGGKLGVKSSGGGGTAIINHNTFNGVNNATKQEILAMVRQIDAKNRADTPSIASQGFRARPGLR